MFVMTTCTCPAPAAGPATPSDGRSWGLVHKAAVAAGDGMTVFAGGVDVAVIPVVVVGDACGALSDKPSPQPASAPPRTNKQPAADRAIRFTVQGSPIRADAAQRIVHKPQDTRIETSPHQRGGPFLVRLGVVLRTSRLGSNHDQPLR